MNLEEMVPLSAFIGQTHHRGRREQKRISLAGLAEGFHSLTAWGTKVDHKDNVKNFIFSNLLEISKEKGHTSIPSLRSMLG